MDSPQYAVRFQTISHWLDLIGRLCRGIEDELQRRIIVGLKCCMLEPQLTFGRMAQGLQAGDTAADIVRAPPTFEFRTAIPQPLQQFGEGRVASPKIMSGTKFGDHAFRQITPTFAKQPPTLRPD